MQKTIKGGGGGGGVGRRVDIATVDARLVSAEMMVVWSC